METEVMTLGIAFAMVEASRPFHYHSGMSYHRRLKVKRIFALHNKNASRERERDERESSGTSSMTPLMSGGPGNVA